MLFPTHASIFFHPERCSHACGHMKGMERSSASTQCVSCKLKTRLIDLNLNVPEAQLCVIDSRSVKDNITNEAQLAQLCAMSSMSVKDYITNEAQLFVIDSKSAKYYIANYQPQSKTVSELASAPNLPISD